MVLAHRWPESKTAQPAEPEDMFCRKGCMDLAAEWSYVHVSRSMATRSSLETSPLTSARSRDTLRRQVWSTIPVFEVGSRWSLVRLCFIRLMSSPQLDRALRPVKLRSAQMSCDTRVRDRLITAPTSSTPRSVGAGPTAMGRCSLPKPALACTQSLRRWRGCVTSATPMARSSSEANWTEAYRSESSVAAHGAVAVVLTDRSPGRVTGVGAGGGRFVRQPDSLATWY